ncbi:site-specific DNA-methyltransferase [Finegoldia magna]|uniref:site-specific DNA-methyltransferase n=1 Tax=Finegoldia magna TaxID=1260 RepID=UPI0026F259BE|nr:site-specific DNA-methyltransferase [Finegoldia magna]MBS5777424.1 site-specific DNA-methyltransferase [Finegoldia magna]
MDKLNMQTRNQAEDKFKKLQELFPNAVTEVMNENGEIEKAIDKDVLMQEISSKVVEGREERYQFTWPDKKQSILAANAPISKTLRPYREESKNFDTTENLYIEGDNLEVLKLLQETYLGKIKMIYIDPPYNTGKDFVYNDDFKQTTDEYLEDSGQFDEEGNRLDKNLESNGRFHTDWLNMIYPRLKLARNLLSDDGVIFISIDDNEQENLKKVCDEIFDKQNFIATFIWQKTYSPKNNNKFVSEDHEFIICFAKDKVTLNELNRLERDEKTDSMYKYDDNDGKGKYRLSDVTIGEKKGYDIVWNGKTYKEPSTRGWAFTEKKIYKLIKEGRIYLPEDETKRPAYKRYLSEVPGLISKTILPYELVGHTQSSKQALDKLIGINIFDYPKPVDLIKYFEVIASDKDSLILDFFSGSATTAHAVMQLNAEDGGNRKYIMVQLPEETDEKSEAYKAGYKNICEIGKERIRRAGEKILEENKDKENIDKLDVGFRVLKTDTSNMKDVYYSPENTEQSFLDNLEDNIKEDRTQEDLLFQVMLDLGVPLSSNIEVEQIEDASVFKVEDRFLVACFDGSISDEVVKQIAEMKPFYAVFRDMSMKNDSVAVNFEQIFESVSPETIRKVL